MNIFGGSRDSNQLNFDFQKDQVGWKDHWNKGSPTAGKQGAAPEGGLISNLPVVGALFARKPENDSWSTQEVQARIDNQKLKVFTALTKLKSEVSELAFFGKTTNVASLGQKVHTISLLLGEIKEWENAKRQLSSPLAAKPVVSDEDDWVQVFDDTEEAPPNFETLSSQITTELDAFVNSMPAGKMREMMDGWRHHKNWGGPISQKLFLAAEQIAERKNLSDAQKEWLFACTLPVIGHLALPEQVPSTLTNITSALFGAGQSKVEGPNRGKLEAFLQKVANGTTAADPLKFNEELFDIYQEFGIDPDHRYYRFEYVLPTLMQDWLVPFFTALENDNKGGRYDVVLKNQPSLQIEMPGGGYTYMRKFEMKTKLQQFYEITEMLEKMKAFKEIFKGDNVNKIDEQYRPFVQEEVQQFNKMAQRFKQLVETMKEYLRTNALNK